MAHARTHTWRGGPVLRSRSFFFCGACQCLLLKSIVPCCGHGRKKTAGIRRVVLPHVHRHLQRVLSLSPPLGCRFLPSICLLSRCISLLLTIFCPLFSSPPCVCVLCWVAGQTGLLFDAGSMTSKSLSFLISHGNSPKELYLCYLRH